MHQDQKDQINKLKNDIVKQKLDTKPDCGKLDELEQELFKLEGAVKSKLTKRHQVLQYMSSLIQRFDIPVFDPKNKCLHVLNQILQDICPNHFANQWLLSLYVVDNDTNINITKYSQSLVFSNGFELLLVFNTCVDKSILVYVNNCVVQCDSVITGIQLHKHNCSNVRFISKLSNIFCVLLRRVPQS